MIKGLVLEPPMMHFTFILKFQGERPSPANVNPVRFSAYYESLWDSVPLLKDPVYIVCYTQSPQYNLI